MSKTTSRIALSAKKQHLIITETEFDDLGLPVNQKRAAVEIDSELDPEVVLNNAKKFVWTVTGELNPATGWYPGAERTDEAAEDIITSANVKNVSSELE